MLETQTEQLQHRTIATFNLFVCASGGEEKYCLQNDPGASKYNIQTVIRKVEHQQNLYKSMFKKHISMCICICMCSKTMEKYSDKVLHNDCCCEVYFGAEKHQNNSVCSSLSICVQADCTQSRQHIRVQSLPCIKNGMEYVLYCLNCKSHTFSSQHHA